MKHERVAVIFHPGGGRREQTIWYDETLCKAFCQWGQVGGQYEIRIGGKRDGQLLSGGGWVLEPEALAQFARIHETAKRKKKAEAKKAQKANA